MERVRYEQLREILALHISPELKEIRRRQAVLQATTWAGMAILLSAQVVLLGLMGVLISAKN